MEGNIRPKGNFEALLEYCLFENIEGLCLNSDRDDFCIVNSSDYTLCSFESRDKEKTDRIKALCNKEKCYKALRNLSEPCEGCGLNRGTLDNASSWYATYEDGTKFVLSHTEKTDAGDSVRLFYLDTADFEAIKATMKSMASSRELLVRCLALISEESKSIDERYEKLVKDVARYFGAETGYLIIFGEHPDLFTYNVTEKHLWIEHSDFSEEYLGKCEERMNLHSVMWFDKSAFRMMGREADLEHVECFNLNNIVVEPIFMGGKLLGFIILGNVQKHKRELAMLPSLAEAVSNLEASTISKNNLRRLMNTDKLTGVLNFEGLKYESMMLVKKNINKARCLCSFDIKDFRSINDVFGYETGDNLLKAMARSISEEVKTDDLVCRINADLFCALFTYENEEDIIDIFAKVSKRMRDFCRKNIDSALKIEISSGAYLIEYGAVMSLNEMFNRAHMARAIARKIPGSNISIYNQKIHEKVRFEKEIELKVDEAIKNNLIVPFFQPQKCVSKRSIASGQLRAEALARWITPEGKIFARPDEFIPVVEKTGQIVEVDHHIYESVCKLIKHIKETGIKPRFSVNVSRITMFSKGFIEYYNEVREANGVDFEDIVLEFTESISVVDMKKFSDLINQLKSIGFVCSMDDFGSDYSSLNNLSTLELNELKLDKAFFLNSGNLLRKRIVVKNIIMMADNLNMETVAEGIEDEDTIKLLEKYGCDYIQGYAYAKPMPVYEFKTWAEKKA